jgi:transcriptional regulator with XRE-family HTH domain
VRPPSAQSDLTKLIVRNIRVLRQRRRVSGVALAKLTGIPRSVITNIENNRRDVITVDELFAFAQALNVSVEVLYTELPPACSVCSDAPPVGFMCMTCGLKLPLSSGIISEA